MVVVLMNGVCHIVAPGDEELHMTEITFKDKDARKEFFENKGWFEANFLMNLTIYKDDNIVFFYSRRKG